MWQRVKLWYGGFGYIIGWKIENAYYDARCYLLGHKPKDKAVNSANGRYIIHFINCERCGKQMPPWTKVKEKR